MLATPIILRQVNAHTSDIKSLDMADRTSKNKDGNRITGIDRKRSYRLSADLRLVAARLERQLKGISYLNYLNYYYFCL